MSRLSRLEENITVTPGNKKPHFKRDASAVLCKRRQTKLDAERRQSCCILMSVVCQPAGSSARKTTLGKGEKSGSSEGIW